MFSTSSIVSASCSWQFPISTGKHAKWMTTFDVGSQAIGPHTENPTEPPGVAPRSYYLNGGVILYRNATYTRTLLRMLLADNASALVAFSGRCCHEQDAVIASTTTSWMNHVGLLPMHVWNCLPGDLHTYGRCLNPFVLHIAGRKSKNNVEGASVAMERLLLRPTPAMRRRRNETYAKSKSG